MSLATRAARRHPGVAGLSARVLAFWFGSLSLVNVLAGSRYPASDLNIWWIDLRFMPEVAGQLLLLAVGGLLVWHGLRAASGGWRRTLSLVAVAIAAIVAFMNAVMYYRIWDTGAIAPRSPVPLSLLIAILLGLIWLSIIRPAPSPPRRASYAAIAAVSLAFVGGLPLLQMAFFGTTDYRRPADAVVVFGARVRSDGAASLTLANRVRTASELYREGLTETIVMTGGIEPTGIDETIVMRDLAVQLGVPSEGDHPRLRRRQHERECGEHGPHLPRQWTAPHPRGEPVLPPAPDQARVRASGVGRADGAGEDELGSTDVGDRGARDPGVLALLSPLGGCVAVAQYGYGGGGGGNAYGSLRPRDWKKAQVTARPKTNPPTCAQ
jgi:hypothetical protein